MLEAHRSADLALLDRHGNCRWVCACPLDGQDASAEHQETYWTSREMVSRHLERFWKALTQSKDAAKEPTPAVGEGAIVGERGGILD